MKILLWFALLLSAALACTGPQCDDFLKRIRLPSDFKVEYYVEHAQGARSLFLSPSNILYISTRTGNVYAALDRDNDGVAEELITLASGEVEPNGIAHRDGNLWLVTMTRILRFDDIDRALIENGKPNTPVVVRTDLPTQRSHGWRYASFNPDPSDPYLYIAFGADCNTCTVEGIEGTIARLDSRQPTGEYEIVAYGVRNSVGFSWHPVTKEFWFTDNGRDNWGDNRPGDELNRVPSFGKHYGFPYCYDNQLVDPEYNQQGHCNGYIPVSQALGPHVAALGNVFYTGDSFPADYNLRLFIAEHGSWNRQVPIGYRLTNVAMNSEGTAPEGPNAYTVFADGWLPDGAVTGSQAWGRPVDVKIAKDGSLLVSDDKNNCVYRISYDPSATGCLGFGGTSLWLIASGSVLLTVGLAMLLSFCCIRACRGRRQSQAQAQAEASSSMTESDKVKLIGMQQA